MEITTVRVPEEVKQELKTEAQDRDMSLGAYIRHILENRAVITENTAPNTPANTDEYARQEDVAQLADRVDDLERRLSEPEPAPPRPRDDRADDPDPSPEPESEEPNVRLDDLDIPGSGTVVEKRQDAIMVMYDYLRESGTGTKSQLLEAVADAAGGDPADAAATVGYQDLDGFWSNCVKGCDTLRTLPDVESPPEGGHTWHFRGDNGDLTTDRGVYDPIEEF